MRIIIKQSIFALSCIGITDYEYMKTRQEYVNIIKSHANVLQSRFGITSMRLFGSVARNEHNDKSDVDLFVTMPPRLYNYIAASQYLSELLGSEVDLIQDHRNLRPFFRKQIEKDGITLIPTTFKNPSGNSMETSDGYERSYSTWIF